MFKIDSKYLSGLTKNIFSTCTNTVVLQNPATVPLPPGGLPTGARGGGAEQPPLRDTHCPAQGRH